MKKLLLIGLIALGGLLQANAQEANRFRVDFDLGYAIPQGGGGGVSFYIEPKWNIKDNMNVGLRLGAAAMAKEITRNGESFDAELGTNASYLGTFDYFFSNGSSSFVPFVGAGVGYYSVASVAFNDNSNEATDIDASGKMGGMLRAGFNWGKFKTTLDYNLVGKSELQNLNGDVIGTTKNGYLGVSVGFFLGGGKWGK